MTWRETLAHAFAVRDPQAVPAPEDLALLDRLAGEIARRRMQAPAILFLESVKPLNFVGSQAMVALQPMAGTLINPLQWERLAALLEQRDTIDLLIRKIEAAHG